MRWGNKKDSSKIDKQGEGQTSIDDASKNRRKHKHGTLLTSRYYGNCMLIGAQEIEAQKRIRVNACERQFAGIKWLPAKLFSIRIKGQPTPNCPVVLNTRRHVIPKDAIFIGPRTKWACPFTIGEDGDAAAVIAKYREYLLSNPKLLADIHELSGKDLACYCAPDPCHGDILLELANKPEPTDKLFIDIKL